MNLECSLSVLNITWFNILFLLPQTSWIIFFKTQRADLKFPSGLPKLYRGNFGNFSAKTLKIRKNLERDSLFTYPLTVMIWHHEDITLHSNELVHEVLSQCHIYIFSTSHWKSISVGMSCIFTRSKALST